MKARYGVMALGMVHAVIALAGGPLELNGSAPVVWDVSSPVTYRLDRGKLGILDEGSAGALCHRAFAVLAQVADSALRFQPDALVDADIASVQQYDDVVKGRISGNVVVFDESGKIVADLYGTANRTTIFGWAQPVPSGGRIVRFYALMNGAMVGDPASYLSTVVHEFGHAVGLDHSQINSEFVLNGDGDDDDYVPTMYPTSTDDDTKLATLKYDDEAWLSRLYPKQPFFGQNFGSLTGRLVASRVGGPAVVGANVIAIGIEPGGADSFSARASCVSDFLKQGDGRFDIPVRAGKFRLKVEAVRDGFSQGSSVGPYASNAFDESFLHRVKTKKVRGPFTVTAGQRTDVGDIPVDYQ